MHHHIEFFHDHRLPKDLAEACLQPIRDVPPSPLSFRRHCNRDRTSSPVSSSSCHVTCQYAISIISDAQELLTTVPAKKSDDGMWDLAQLAQNGATVTPLDYLSEFVQIFPDVSVHFSILHQQTFVRKTEDFFASQLLVATEESEETLA